MPQHLDEIAAPAAEDEQIAPVRIALQLLLHGQRQTIEAFAHVGVAGRNPDLHALWNRDHRRSNTASTRSSAAMSTLASNVTRAPVKSAISIRPAGVGVCAAASAGAGFGTASQIRAGANSTAGSSSPSRPSRTALRQVDNKPRVMLCRRATADTRRGPAMLSATMRNFSAVV